MVLLSVLKTVHKEVPIFVTDRPFLPTQAIICTNPPIMIFVVPVGFIGLNSWRGRRLRFVAKVSDYGL